MSTREPTLVELLEEAADCYGMPIGTGERLREAAGRIREEMSEARENFAIAGDDGDDNGMRIFYVVQRCLERINGGPSPDPGKCGRCGGGKKVYMDDSVERGMWPGSRAQLVDCPDCADPPNPRDGDRPVPTR